MERMEMKFFELIEVMQMLAEIMDDISEAIETINGHQVEITWVEDKVVGINIDGKEYGGYTTGEFAIDIDELFEIMELCGEEEEEPVVKKPEFPVAINNRTFTVTLEDFNQQYNVYLTGDENMVVPKPKPIDELENGYFVYCEDNLGFSHYGFVSKCRSYDRPAGYTWSSRASVLNTMLPYHITEVVYNRESANIRVHDLFEIVDVGRKKGYSLAVDLDDSDGEFQYSIVDPTNPDHEIHRIIY